MGASGISGDDGDDPLNSKSRFEDPVTKSLVHQRLAGAHCSFQWVRCRARSTGRPADLPVLKDPEWRDRHPRWRD